MARPFIVTQGGAGVVTPSNPGPQLWELMSGLRRGQRVEWVETKEEGRIQTLNTGKVEKVRNVNGTLHIEIKVDGCDRRVTIQQPQTKVAHPPYVLQS